MTPLEIKKQLIFSKYDRSILSNTGIYIIRNSITNIIYIGSATCTKATPSKCGFRGRFSHHINSLCANNHRNQHLQYSWNKYGYKAFSFEIREILNPKEALERELELLQNTKLPLYNICKTSLSRTNKTISDKNRDMLSKRFKGIPRPKDFGLQFANPVLQFTKDNIFIREYCSVSEAARNLKIQRQDIGQVCLGHGITAGGYVWKYKN